VTGNDRPFDWKTKFKQPGDCYFVCEIMLSAWQF